MEAKILNLSLTPKSDCEKVLTDFLYLWPTPKLKVQLLDLFHQLAVHGILDEQGPQYTDDIALLFDQLIDLVAAAHQLHQEGRAPFNQHQNIQPEQEGSHE